MQACILHDFLKANLVLPLLDEVRENLQAAITQHELTIEQQRSFLRRILPQEKEAPLYQRKFTEILEEEIRLEELQDDLAQVASHAGLYKKALELTYHIIREEAPQRNARFKQEYDEIWG